jgi:hypothetical protein
MGSFSNGDVGKAQAKLTVSGACIVAAFSQQKGAL